VKLYFSWEYSGAGLSPYCRSSILNEDGVSPLACLLNDDGGVYFLDTTPWLKEGLTRISNVRSSNILCADWSRDAWGAEFTKAQVKIYSLYNENYIELLDVESCQVAFVAGF
jgi:hypothetical protein